jgi:phage baseplate assembly protein V
MDLNDFKRLITPLRNKIFLLLGRAVLEAVKNTEMTQKIQITALDEEVISDMERFQEYGFETYPLEGAEVLATFFNGNRDHGITICVHDRRYRPTDLAAGEVAVYTDEDSSDFRIHLKRGRIFGIKGDQWEDTLDTSKKVTTPSETHTNSTEHIIDSPEVSLGGATFAALRKLIDERFITLFNTHVHSGVTVGAGSTAVPTALASEANHATSKVKGI